jgi:hypothetical protein
MLVTGLRYGSTRKVHAAAVKCNLLAALPRDAVCLHDCAATATTALTARQQGTQDTLRR